MTNCVYLRDVTKSLRASVTSPGGFAVRSPFRDFVHLKVLQNAKHFAKPPGVMGNLKNRHTTLKLIITIGLLFGLTSCSYYGYPPKVDTRTEIQYSYKRHKNFKTSKWKKTSQKTGYERYDKKGNLIEEGNYGEIWHFRSVKKNSDSSISVTSGHGYNYK